MKLNLGCGNDIITGYKNIDIVQHKGAELGDFRDLDSLNIQKGTVEEIRAINVIECIPIQFIRHIITHWISKLKPNGELYLSSHDISLICNKIAFGQVSVENAMTIIFGDPNQPNLGGSSMAEMLDILKQLGLKINQSGYVDYTYFIRASK